TCRRRTTAPIAYTTLFRSQDVAAQDEVPAVLQPVHERNPVEDPGAFGHRPQPGPACGGLGHEQHGVVPLADDPAGALERVAAARSEEHTSELQSRENLVCR